MSDNFIYNVNFRRKFSFNSYKSLRMKMGEMSFTKDWTKETDRGDMYPLINKVGEIHENVSEGKYTLDCTSENAEISRILGRFSLNNSYSLDISQCSKANLGISILTDEVSDKCGFKKIDFYAKITDKKFLVCYRINGEETVISHNNEFENNINFIITFSCENVDFYYEKNSVIYPITSLNLPCLEKLSYYDVFSKTSVALLAEFEEKIVLNKVEFFIDAGISQADIHVIKYENAMPIIENGKIFLTVTSRNLNGGHQSVLSWNYNTCEFKLEGILYFDSGDGKWSNDIASSIVFDRNNNEWYIWYCSFSHGHVLGRGKTKNDPRFGINVIDTHLMPIADNFSDTDFIGKKGDEDPDLTFDDKTGKWYLTICRVVNDNGVNRYRYFLFESDNPLDGFVYKDKTLNGSNTGGSFLKVVDKLFFVCGSDADKRAKYNIYPVEDFSDEKQLKCDYDDGGFRGWGTVVPVYCGNRTKYVWITFDRTLFGLNNWSYGNIYVFESDAMHDGYIN